MSFIPYWKQVAESEAFNWKCIICNIVAQSPLIAEEQWQIEYRQIKDLDGVTLRVKC